mmetsp:Transcript_13709/g.37009  ORF Transcript_13709/g.37009 Transcript_13709/m.37009 type:complete len:380 (+) Transcript_13709:2251-3390(+)
MPSDKKCRSLADDIVSREHLACLWVWQGEHAGCHVLHRPHAFSAGRGKRAAAGGRRCSAAERAAAAAVAAAQEALLLCGDQGVYLLRHLVLDALQIRNLSRHHACNQFGGREAPADAPIQAHPGLRELRKEVKEAARLGQRPEVVAEADFANNVEGVTAQERVQVDGASGTSSAELLDERLGGIQDDRKIFLHPLHGEGRQQNAGRLVVDGLVVVRGEKALARHALAQRTVLEEPLLEDLWAAEHLTEHVRVRNHRGGAPELLQRHAHKPRWDLDREEAAILGDEPGNVHVHAAVWVPGDVLAGAGRPREVTKVPDDGQGRRAARDRDALGVGRLLTLSSAPPPLGAEDGGKHRRQHPSGRHLGGEWTSVLFSGRNETA